MYHLLSSVAYRWHLRGCSLEQLTLLRQADLSPAHRAVLEEEIAYRTPLAWMRWGAG